MIPPNIIKWASSFRRARVTISMENTLIKIEVYQLRKNRVKMLSKMARLRDFTQSVDGGETLLKYIKKEWSGR